MVVTGHGGGKERDMEGEGSGRELEDVMLGREGLESRG